MASPRPRTITPDSVRSSVRQASPFLGDTVRQKSCHGAYRRDPVWLRPGTHDRESADLSGKGKIRRIRRAPATYAGAAMGCPGRPAGLGDPAYRGLHPAHRSEAEGPAGRISEERKHRIKPGFPYYDVERPGNRGVRRLSHPAPYVEKRAS